jgi:hypothetical protein
MLNRARLAEHKALAQIDTDFAQGGDGIAVLDEFGDRLHAEVTCPP